MAMVPREAGMPCDSVDYTTDAEDAWVRAKSVTMSIRRMSLVAGYRYLMSSVARADGSGQQTLGDAVSVVRDFVDPILAGTATGSWDPVTLRWRRRF